MRYFSLLVLLLFPLLLLARGRNERAIRKLLATQVEGWNQGNIDAYMKGYWEHDSLLFIGSKGPRYGYANTLASYKKSYPDKDHTGTLTSTVVSIKRLSPKYYFVVGKWHLARNAGEVGGSYTLLLHKVHRQWVIVADHSS